MAHALRIALPPEPASAGRARRLTEEVLTQLGLVELVESAQLAVSELVTNALLHGRSPVDLQIDRTDDGVRIGVSDGSTASPVVRDYGELAATGRGLHLVSELARQVGVEPHDGGGKTVWFELDRHGQPLGETAWPSAVAPVGNGARVVLLRLPVRLWAAAQQHHDAMLRELLLHRLDAGDDEQVPATSDLAAAESAQALLATAFAAAAGGPRSTEATEVDVELAARPDDLPGFAALQDVLDDAEELATKGELLALPGLPEVVALRDWCCEQVVAQCQGVAAAPWVTHYPPRSPRSEVSGLTVSRPDWDDAWVRTSTDALVAADDHNRILAVSEPASEMLGWDADDLVGRRLVTLIPERFREAHVAGFTRHLTTGEHRLLGDPLELPVLRHDDTEMVCRLQIDAAPAREGRRVFVARLEPLV